MSPTRPETLFESQAPRPLADRLRPTSLDDVVGQQHLLAADGPVGRMVAAGRIASMAGSDKRCLETTYLVCLSRRPTPAEQQYFLAQLHETTGKKRQKMAEDIFWSLLNSPEFSWDH